MIKLLRDDIEANTGLRTTKTEKDGSWVSLQSTNGTLAILDQGKFDLDLAKLRLRYDKPLARILARAAAVGQFVYPSGTNGAVDHIYEVLHFLETPSATINIRRSGTFSKMWEYSRSERHFDSGGIFYKAVKVSDGYQEFELCGRQSDPFACNMTMHKDWTGSWNIRHIFEGNPKPYFLRTTSDWSRNKEGDSRWMIQDGTLQARSEWDDAAPWVYFELSIERRMQDLIVACWVFNLRSETAALQRRNQ
ncbi:MAG: hypothetical protein Q9161_008965 [Pseudevernia consocians]